MSAQISLNNYYNFSDIFITFEATIGLILHLYTVVKRKVMILIVRSVSKWYPELFLVCAVLLYWIFTATLINPVAIILITALNAQLVIKNKTFGIVLASVFMLLSIYMTFALVSEVFQMESFLTNGLLLLVSGLVLFSFTGYFGYALLQKNIAFKPERLSIEND